MLCPRDIFFVGRIVHIIHIKIRSRQLEVDAFVTKDSKYCLFQRPTVERVNSSASNLSFSYDNGTGSPL